VKRERLGVAESVNALKDKRSTRSSGSAHSHGGGDRPRRDARYEDQADRPCRVPSTAMNKKSGPLYVKADIPRARTRPGEREPDRERLNILGRLRKMSDQTAYNIVKTMFEKKPELVAVHKEATNIGLQVPEQQCVADPVSPRRDQVLQEQGIELKYRSPGRDARDASATAEPAPPRAGLSIDAFPAGSRDSPEGAQQASSGIPRLSDPASTGRPSHISGVRLSHLE